MKQYQYKTLTTISYRTCTSTVHTVHSYRPVFPQLECVPVQLGAPQHHGRYEALVLAAELGER